MFEIGFSELLMLALISLLVIGPERLPKVARVAGFWVGKLQRTVAGLKAEIRHELQVEEMRQLLKQRSELDDYRQAVDEITDTVDDIKSSFNHLPETGKPDTVKRLPDDPE